MNIRIPALAAVIATGLAACQKADRTADQAGADSARHGGADTLVTDRTVKDTTIVRHDTTVRTDTIVKHGGVADTGTARRSGAPHGTSRRP